MPKALDGLFSSIRGFGKVILKKPTCELNL